MRQSEDFQTLAHKLLDELDERHDRLLAEIDLLNQRVDSVLSQYTVVKPESSQEKPSDDQLLEDED